MNDWLPALIGFFVGIAFVVIVALFLLPPEKPGSKVRVLMALTVRKGKKGKLKLVTDPPGSPIDLKDVAVTVESSDPATVEAVLEADGRVAWRTLAGGTAGPVSVTAKADADQDLGEVRLLDGRFDFDVVDSVEEPTSVALELDGPVEDDV